MFTVVCYDVVQDKRRTRLHKRLKGFLSPVQKSVFEGELPPTRLTPLLDTITRTIDHRTDTVRIYELCKGCRPLTRVVGVGREPVGPPEDRVL